MLPRCQKGHPFTFLALYSSELSQWGQLGTREGITQKYITVEGRFWSPFKKLGSHENTITQNRADGEFSELADVSKEDGNVRVAQ